METMHVAYHLVRRPWRPRCPVQPVPSRQRCSGKSPSLGLPCWADMYGGQWVSLVFAFSKLFRRRAMAHNMLPSLL
jgi:hypothetical protein